MPESIEAGKRHQKRSAVLGVGTFALIKAAVAVGLWALGRIPALPGWLTGLCTALGIIPLVLLIPALAVLRQRFHEIERGEHYEAGQY